MTEEIEPHILKKY